MGSNQNDLPLSSTSLVASHQELAENWQRSAQSKGKNQGILASSSFVLLAACEPHQYAYEFTFDGEEKYGAFTYWLIDTLNEIEAPITCKHLIDEVKAKVHKKFSKQTPMLLGEGESFFFGTDKISKGTVLKVDSSSGQVLLSLESIHNLNKGKRFAVYPLSTTDFTESHSRIAVVEVIEFNASNAKARILSTHEGGIELQQPIEPGCPAISISKAIVPLELLRRVYLKERDLGEKQHQIPPELIDKQKAALEAVRQSLSGNGWLIEIDDEHASDYQVLINRQGEYEIDSGVPIDNLNPPQLIDDPKAPEKIVKRLVHLAKYHTVLALNNPDSTLSNDMEFELLGENGQTVPNPTPITLRQGDLVRLHLKNVSTQSLYAAVLDLEATWEISQIPLGGVDTSHYELAPQQTLEMRLRFAIPEGEGYRQARETLKLIVSQDPIDFSWLRLPPLDQQTTERISPSKRQTDNALARLRAAIASDTGITPQEVNTIYDSHSIYDWATKQIQITIVE